MFEVNRAAHCSMTVLRGQRPPIFWHRLTEQSIHQLLRIYLALLPKPSRFAPVVVNTIAHNFCLSPRERTEVKANDLYV